MKKLHITGTKSTPTLKFDHKAQPFLIKGESYPENAARFYKPLFAWLRNFLGDHPDAPVTLDLEIAYFNSSSSKIFMNLFDLLEDEAEEGRSVVVNWRYHPDNETALECGQEFQEDLSALHFNLLAWSDDP